MSTPDHTTNPPLKRCTKCGEYKPATLEFFHRQANRRSGLRQPCKACRSQSIIPKPKPMQGFKYCSSCQEFKPDTEEFFRIKTYSYGNRLNSQCRSCEKRYNKQYSCSSKAKEVQRAYRQSHSAQVIERSQNWQREHPEQVRAAARARWQKNPDKYRQQHRKWIKEHPDSANQYNRNWYASNIDYARMRNVLRSNRRRARQTNLPDTFTNTEWVNALDYWNGCCVYCGSQQGFLKHQKICADHWIPLTDPNCPGTVAGNIVPACFSCNASKNDRDPVEWLKSKYAARKAGTLIKNVYLYFDWVKAQ